MLTTDMILLARTVNYSFNFSVDYSFVIIIYSLCAELSGEDDTKLRVKIASNWASHKHFWPLMRLAQ